MFHENLKVSFVVVCRHYAVQDLERLILVWQRRWKTCVKCTGRAAMKGVPLKHRNLTERHLKGEKETEVAAVFNLMLH
jgi:hypothetical protein